jgi:glutathione transport system permease protein
MIPLLVVVSFLIFMFIRMIPGDPARLLAGQDATVEEIEKIQRLYGLNDPLFVQYGRYIAGLFSGDMGTSLRTGRPVADMLLPRYSATFTLALTSMGWALLIGLTIGVVTAVFRGRWPDYIGMLVAVAGISVPGFWMGLVLIQRFAVEMPIFAVTGLRSMKDFVLPSITLGAGIMAMIARNSRSEMSETMRHDYIRTARAKGLSEPEVILKHALRNSMVQVMTIIGLQFGFLLGGSVVVERVFGIAGLGGLLVDSIFFRDYTVIQAELTIFAFLFIMVNLLVDLMYGLLNPKIRYGGGGADEPEQPV